MKIDDGTGSGNRVRIDSDNRMATSSITETQSAHNTELGNKFNLNTGCITLTSAAKTTVMYLKNNECSPIFINTLIYNLGATACGSGDVVVDWVRNPTAGDIITNANNVCVNSNLNYGSSETLSADVFKGATGETVVSDGTKSGSTRSSINATRITVPLDAIILNKGDSLAIDYTPPTGNTSQITQFIIVMFVNDVPI